MFLPAINFEKNMIRARERQNEWASERQRKHEKQKKKDKNINTCKKRVVEKGEKEEIESNGTRVTHQQRYKKMK